ncbi:hypothetical protein V6Z11_A13G068000 [Gossypium hirsutum]
MKQKISLADRFWKLGCVADGMGRKLFALHHVHDIFKYY